MTDPVHVKGLDELTKFLGQLPEKLQKNVMRGALRAGAKVIREDAKGRVHNVSGEVAAGLKVGSISKGGQIFAYVRASGKHGFVARFLEWGTRPHFIKGKGTKGVNRAQRLGYLDLHGVFISGAVKHPGAKPQPFMRPALDASAGVATIAVGNYIKHRLATKHGLDTSDVSVEGEE